MAGLLHLRASRIKMPTKNKGLGFRNPLCVFSVPKGCEAKFLSDWIYNTLNNCILNKCQTHP